MLGILNLAKYAQEDKERREGRVMPGGKSAFVQAIDDYIKQIQSGDRWIELKD